jgi:branched-chain amino acid transport system permease protein
MDAAQFFVQVLNGIQYGFLAFLVASGLTLVFSIMGIINLAHGAFCMIGAYLAFWLTGVVGSLFLAIPIGLAAAVVLAVVIERFAIALIYRQSHLQQVLLTFGLTLILNEAQRLIWGSDFHSVAVPDVLAGSIPLTEREDYQIYRLFVGGVCMAVAAGLYVTIEKTRFGMIIRASASNRQMAQALGVHVPRLFTLVFSLGVALAALAGMIGAPLTSVYPGMGDRILIVSFIIVVIGGVGSIKGAFVGAMAVGLADTFGRVLIPELASIVIYALMAIVLLWRPQGLFGTAP